VPRDQTPWAEQADLLDLVEVTHGVLEEVGSAGFAGFVVTPEECRLDLYWVGPPPHEVVEVIRHDRRVVVHDDAKHDHDELSRAAEALAPGSPLGRSAGVEITSVAVPPEGTGPVFAPTRTGGNDVHAVGVVHGGVEGARVGCGDHASAECSESVIFVPVAEVQRWIGGELRVADGWKSPPRPQTGR
jgi:hypothetical protein